MIINITIDKQELRQLVLKEINNRLSGIPFLESDVSIKTKSEYNYKAEWEEADFNASIIVNTNNNFNVKN